MKEGGYEEPELSPTYDILNKNVCYLAALQNIGTTQKNTEEITEFDTAPCPPDNFHPNWSQYPGDTRFELKPEITIDMQKLYIRGRGEGG